MGKIQGYAVKISSSWTLKWLQVQTFYNGLSGNTKTLVDAVTGGVFIGKTIDEVYQLLEKMAANNYKWPSERSSQKKAMGVYK